MDITQKSEALVQWLLQLFAGAKLCGLCLTIGKGWSSMLAHYSQQTLLTIRCDESPQNYNAHVYVLCTSATVAFSAYFAGHSHFLDSFWRQDCDMSRPLRLNLTSRVTWSAHTKCGLATTFMHSYVHTHIPHMHTHTHTSPLQCHHLRTVLNISIIWPHNVVRNMSSWALLR